MYKTAYTLEEIAQKIHESTLNEVRAKIETGQWFVIAKEQHPQNFIQWTRTDFPHMDYGTILNYMSLANLVESKPDLNVGEYPLSVLYKLGRHDTSAEVFTLVERAESQDIKIDRDLIARMKRSPEYLRKEYAAGGQISDMLECAEALADAPADVFSDCQHNRVKRSETVRWLADKYQKFMNGESTSYHEIMEDNGTLNGEGWSKPLGEATPMDLKRYNRDRSTMHKDNGLAEYHLYKSEVRVEGSLITINLPQEIADSVEGQTVRVLVRYKT